MIFQFNPLFEKYGQKFDAILYHHNKSDDLQDLKYKDIGLKIKAGNILTANIMKTVIESMPKEQVQCEINDYNSKYACIEREVFIFDNAIINWFTYF